MNAQDLKDRTKQFALRVMHLVDALPDTPKGRAVASQLVRSGMSIAANYRAARRKDLGGRGVGQRRDVLFFAAEGESSDSRRAAVGRLPVAKSVREWDGEE